MKKIIIYFLLLNIIITQYSCKQNTQTELHTEFGKHKIHNVSENNTVNLLINKIDTLNNVFILINDTFIGFRSDSFPIKQMKKYSYSNFSLPLNFKMDGFDEKRQYKFISPTIKAYSNDCKSCINSLKLNKEIIIGLDSLQFKGYYFLPMSCMFDHTASCNNYHRNLQIHQVYSSYLMVSDDEYSELSSIVGAGQDSAIGRGFGVQACPDNVLSVLAGNNTIIYKYSDFCVTHSEDKINFPHKACIDCQ